MRRNEIDPVIADVVPVNSEWDSDLPFPRFDLASRFK